MTCWHCGKIMLCNCSNCGNKPQPPDAFIEKVKGDIIFCGYCGFSLHIDAWETLEFEDCERNGIGAFKDRGYDYDHYVKVLSSMSIPLSFSVKRPTGFWVNK